MRARPRPGAAQKGTRKEKQKKKMQNEANFSALALSKTRVAVGSSRVAPGEKTSAPGARQRVVFSGDRG
jgi:hypothetical protein